MCNLYSMMSGPQAIIDFADHIKQNLVGNFSPRPGIYLDYEVPVVRKNAGERELAFARWGMPSPAFALKGKKTDPGVTNVRNTASPHWRRWLGPDNRCVVPWTSFSEPEPQPDGKRPPAWFAFDESQPLAFFAGIWTPQHKSVRKGERR